MTKPNASKQFDRVNIFGDIDSFRDEGPWCWECELTFNSFEDAPPDCPLHFCSPDCRREWSSRQPLQNLLDKRKINVNTMADLNESTAKRIAKLVRLMSSEYDGEWSNAVRMLKLVLQNEGLTFNDLAAVIENCDGAIEERKYSDADAAIIFARGLEKGRAEEAHKREAPPEFYDADGHAALERHCAVLPEESRPATR